MTGSRWASVPETIAYDGLAGLCDRTTFRACGIEAVRAAGPLAVAIVAIDGFRAVNDTLGEREGDQILEIASRLGARAAAGDVVACLGGDTFGIIMAGARRAEVEGRVRRCAEAFADALDASGTDEDDVSLTASIGVAVAPEDGEDFDAICARAGAAVHDAKQTGHACCTFFTRKVEDDLHAARRLTHELTEALRRNELLLHFQPHVELRTRRVAGAEALLRWNHRNRGLVAPSEIVAFAEHHGLAQELNMWVLRETLRLTAAWRRADPAFTAWFNLSASELRDASLVARMADAGRGVHGVGIEITESAVMAASSETVSAIAALRDAGFKIALDDFGTGYSSLAHVRHLPIDVIKIDRSFVAGVPCDDRDLAIVEAVISIAQRYGFATVAEGVETLEQAAVLSRGGCTYAQGYLYARPMPAEQLYRWLDAWSGARTAARHDVA